MNSFDVPHETSMLDVSFGGNVATLLPSMEDIPDEFKGGSTPQNKMFNEWFFKGLQVSALTVKEGINKARALDHLKAVMVSYDPKHEHKEAGVAYLMSLWFETPKQLPLR